MKIKICGIKKIETIEILNEMKIDYLGFVFAESKRQVTAQKASELGRYLNPQIKKVGVFVDGTMDEIMKIVDAVGLDVVQLHGEQELNSMGQTLKKRIGRKIDVWQAIRVKDERSLDALSNNQVDAYVLDSYSVDSFGGSGKTFDWNIVRALPSTTKIILAGGLNSSNVKKAISLVSPYSLDVSSGVEVDGEKDERLIREFVRVVREADTKLSYYSN